ncbi:hypothetical protein C9374_014058 [Naegleria lovaniensis]|uniref:NYN domain-containing protein n=1 Tax=Naegleria lovaniensis TaxID=51637 RepID=A0AA88KPI6_NAELO|nr:uncharacterized protein C9374_014058 [Naegleria lovaniensis]KAG2389498.1 hypothetical protein C9374_014058 [Naegleria lovaniensis]
MSLISISKKIAKKSSIFYSHFFENHNTQPQQPTFEAAEHLESLCTGVQETITSLPSEESTSSNDFTNATPLAEHNLESMENTTTAPTEFYNSANIIIEELSPQSLPSSTASSSSTQEEDIKPSTQARNKQEDVDEQIQETKFHINEYNNRLLNQILEMNSISNLENVASQAINMNSDVIHSGDNFTTHQQQVSSLPNSMHGSLPHYHVIQCLIYWDYENISLSSNMIPSSQIVSKLEEQKSNITTTSLFLTCLLTRLEKELTNYYATQFPNSNVIIKVNAPFIKVYGDMYQIPKYRRTEFYQNGCHLIDVPHLGTTRKEVVDKMMITDVLMDLNIFSRPIFPQFFGHNHYSMSFYNTIPSSAIILLTGDQDFCNLLARLKYQSIPSVVVIKKDQSQHGGSVFDEDQSLNTLLQSSTFWIPFEEILNDSIAGMEQEKRRLLQGGGLQMPSSKESTTTPAVVDITSSPVKPSKSKTQMTLDEYIESVAPQTPRELVPKDIKLISFILLKYLEPLELGNLSSKLVNLNIQPKKLKKFIESYDSGKFLELTKANNSTNIILVDRKKVLKLLPSNVKVSTMPVKTTSTGAESLSSIISQEIPKESRVKKEVVSTPTLLNEVSSLQPLAASDEVSKTVEIELKPLSRNSAHETSQASVEENNEQEMIDTDKNSLPSASSHMSLENYMLRYLSPPNKRDLDINDMHLICFLLLLEDSMELGALSNRLFTYNIKPKALKKKLIEFNTMGDKNGNLVGIFKLEQKGNMLLISLTDRDTVLSLIPENVEYIPPKYPSLSSMLLFDEQNYEDSTQPNDSHISEDLWNGSYENEDVNSSSNPLISPNMQSLIPKQQQPSWLLNQTKPSNTLLQKKSNESPSSSPTLLLLRSGQELPIPSFKRKEETGKSVKPPPSTEDHDDTQSTTSDSSTASKKSISNDLLLELESKVKEMPNRRMSYMALKKYYKSLGYNTKHLQRKISQISPHLTVVQRGNDMMVEYSDNKSSGLGDSKKEPKIATFHSILLIIEQLSKDYPYEADLSVVGTLIKQLGWKIEGNMKLKDFLQMNDTSQILQFDKSKNNWIVRLKKHPLRKQ